MASGETLPLTQDEVQSNGHAIEVRLYAEDPVNGFSRRLVTFYVFDIPELDDCRTDHGVMDGQQVTPFYDPMLAKLIAWAPDRETARRKLSRIVKHSQILGMTTNQGFSG